MTRQKTAAPHLCLHRPSGQAVVRIRGRVIYLGAFGSPEAEANYQRTIAEWRAHGAPRPAQSPLLTVGDLVARFWRHVEADGLYRKNGRATSEPSCLRVALRPLVALYGGKPAAAFGPLDQAARARRAAVPHQRQQATAPPRLAAGAARCDHAWNEGLRCLRCAARRTEAWHALPLPSRLAAPVPTCSTSRSPSYCSTSGPKSGATRKRRTTKRGPLHVTGQRMRRNFE
jgi:hypothetical protein